MINYILKRIYTTTNTGTGELFRTLRRRVTGTRINYTIGPNSRFNFYLIESFQLINQPLIIFRSQRFNSHCDYGLAVLIFCFIFRPALIEEFV